MKLDKRACRHAANVPLHISMNAGVLYTERVKYLVTAAVKLLGGHRVLAVYFYECERLKANDRMPKWVVFQGKDTFATLERDAEGNVKWRDAMVQHLTDYYMGDFLQSCVFYKKAGCHTIARYIGAKSDPTKVLWELNWYQQDIRDQQTKIRRYKRDTVVLNKMSSVPQTPANLKRWADKHIMPHYLFYDYNNGRVKTQVYCTYCEKFSVIKRPKNNDVLRCPKCDQKVIAKAQGRRAAYYEDRETCQVVQQISPHELVVRIYKLYWSYVKGKDTTRKSAYIDKISEITTFFDLQISQDENDLTAYLDYTLREYRKANIKSKRYGRYYISLLINILSAATLNPPEDENLFSSPLLCRIYNICKNDVYFGSNAPGFSYIFLYLLDRLYTENERSDFTKDFLKKILSLNIVNCYISDFSKIPTGLVSRSALNALAEDYYLIISSDDTY